MNTKLTHAVLTFIRRSERFGISRSKIILSMASRANEEWTYGDLCQKSEITHDRLRSAVMIPQLIKDELVSRHFRRLGTSNNHTPLFSLTEKGKALAASLIA